MWIDKSKAEIEEEFKKLKKEAYDFEKEHEG